MALGDKFPVVMGKEKAVANGVATLGADGKLSEGQRPTPTESGAADRTLSNLSNYQKALRNIGGRPNRNLLDNAYFVGGGSQQGDGQFPINQRGQTSYTAAGSIVDRWKLTNSNGTFTLTEDGCTLAGTSGSIWIQYYLENPSRFYGKEVTISLLTDEQLVTTTGALTTGAVTQDTGFSVSGSNDLTIGFYKRNDGGVFFQVGVTSGNSHTLVAAKLELGPTQTLAYQDEDGNWQLFETPDYGEELAKCQASQVVIPTLDIIGCTNNTTTLYANIPTPVPMRAVPSIENNGVFVVRGNGTNRSNLTASTYGTSLSPQGIRVGITGEFLANVVYCVNINGQIILNAGL